LRKRGNRPTDLQRRELFQKESHRPRDCHQGSIFKKTRIGRSLTALKKDVVWRDDKEACRSQGSLIFRRSPIDYEIPEDARWGRNDKGMDPQVDLQLPDQEEDVGRRHRDDDGQPLWDIRVRQQQGVPRAKEHSRQKGGQDRRFGFLRDPQHSLTTCEAKDLSVDKNDLQKAMLVQGLVNPMHFIVWL
jgi:hypothetical protein